MKNSWDVIRKPLVTEKSMSLQQQNVYTFIVDSKANKPDIRRAVEEAFNVKVERVRTETIKGKRKRMRNMLLYGRRRDLKKAFVTLKEGQRLDII
ncbi:MAG: 50S ribosomal protein L23 [Planctomycetota bacterium]|jgi:large subunit ribosomal protein L23